MPRSHSPLRYPGGKACLTPLLTSIIKLNSFHRWHYAEPYAGGCGLALSLLLGGFVSDIHINDLDPSIWSFWKAVLDHTDELCALIETTDLSVAVWREQREIQEKEDHSDPLRLGFATFFLNRTNRSGIIKGAGVIGGLAQTGNYKMDCRFNREELKRRIRRIGRYRSQVHLSRLDAVDFMAEATSRLPSSSFFCIDPPYYRKGSALYTSYYGPSDHDAVAEAVSALGHPWVMTYDNVEPIKQLYRTRRLFEFDIKYSVQTKRVGTELLIAPEGLVLPDEIRGREIRGKPA